MLKYKTKDIVLCSFAQVKFFIIKWVILAKQLVKDDAFTANP